MTAARTSVLIVRPVLSQGGADRVTRTLLAELPRDRFAPSLALVHGGAEDARGLPADVPLHVLDARRTALAAPALLRLVRRTRPAVLFSTGTGTNIPALLAALALEPERRRALRVVISERNVLFHGGVTPRRALITAAKRVLYPYADAITAVSDGVAADLCAQLSLPRERVAVVYNPVVTPDVERGARAHCDHRFFAAGAARPVVLGVGRLVKEKGFDVLLAAFARARTARRSGAAPRLILLGEGPLRGALAERARALGLGDDDVDMPGYVDNPFAYMARCSLFVLSSRHEGLPGALIQAMACGAPVVSTDCPSGPSEIIARPRDEGLLVPVDDADALGRAIGDVLGDDELRARLAAGGRRAAQRFGLSSSMARYIDAIDPRRGAVGWRGDESADRDRTWERAA